MTRELEQLVREAKKKNPAAFTELMESQKQMLYKTARSILSNDEDIADAMQDTILTCWEKMDALKEECFFRTWIIRILINKCFDMIKAGKRVVYVEAYPEIPAKEGDFHEEWEEMLDALEEDLRLVVILYYAQGFRTKEIAQILGVSDPTVRKKLVKARKQIKKYWQEARGYEG